MAFDVNNFVINRIIRGSMVVPSTGDIAWSITQIKDPSLKCTGETTDALDALGAPIITFNKAKRAEFSATNSLFDLNLAAAQFGGSKNIATASKKITTPKFEEFEITDGQTTVVLSQTPVGTVGAELKQIYKLNTDNSMATKYTIAASASATEFKFDIATKTVTLPTGLEAGSRILVRYDYQTENAVSVSNSATDFPKAGKFIMEVLGNDVCSPDITYHAYVIFPNASLSSDVDLTFSTEGNHPFSMKANQAYCDIEKKLFDIIVPQA